MLPRVRILGFIALSVVGDALARTECSAYVYAFPSPPCGLSGVHARQILFLTVDTSFLHSGLFMGVGGAYMRSMSYGMNAYMHFVDSVSV